MTYTEAKNDILKTDLFSPEELEKHPRNKTMFKVFESIEFYQIFYLSDTDLYYIDEETEQTLKTADTIKDTEKGRIYCYS